MAGIKWSEEEDKLLKDLWPTCSKEEILKYLISRTYDSIIIRASNLGIRKFYEKHPYVKSNLSVLLEDTPETLYWMGFLFADGSINEYKRLSLVLAIKDKDHLLNFKKFCEIPNHLYIKDKKKIISIGVKAQDKFTVEKLCNKYDLKSNKTIHPPDYIPKNVDLFLAFIVGFIDGDGCIKKQSGKRKDSLIAIKLHNSWMDYLNRLSVKVAELAQVKPTNAKINKKGYAIIHFCNSKLLKFLKNKALQLGLPVLERKWDRIDLSYFSKNEIMANNRKKLASLVSKGLRNRDIAKKLQVSEAWVSVEKRKLK